MIVQIWYRQDIVNIDHEGKPFPRYAAFRMAEASDVKFHAEGAGDEARYTKVGFFDGENWEHVSEDNALQVIVGAIVLNFVSDENKARFNKAQNAPSSDRP